jgi:hypothetical protein
LLEKINLLRRNVNGSGKRESVHDWSFFVQIKTRNAGPKKPQKERQSIDPQQLEMSQIITGALKEKKAAHAMPTSVAILCHMTLSSAP